MNMKKAALILVAALAISPMVLPSGMCALALLGVGCCCSDPDGLAPNSSPAVPSCCSTCCKSEEATLGLRCLLNPQSCCAVLPDQEIPVEVRVPTVVDEELTSQALSATGAINSDTLHLAPPFYRTRAGPLTGPLQTFICVYLT